MFIGVERVGWDELGVPEVPELLRSAASDDRDEAGEALTELWQCAMHQGTVCAATEVMVPFLVELCFVAGHGRHAVVALVGMVTDEHHAGPARLLPGIRRAVAGQRDRLAPLLSDPDAEVRAEAVYTLTRAGIDITQRWAVETHPAVRASLVLALAETTGNVPQELVHDDVPAVRAAVAVASLRAGAGLARSAVSPLAEAFVAGGDIGFPWLRRQSAFAEVATDAGADVAVALLSAVLADDDPKVRMAAVGAAATRCHTRRSGPELVVPLVGPLLDDPDPEVRFAAAVTLHRAGSAVRQVADSVARIAASYPDVADRPGIGVEQQCLSILGDLGDPRWIEPACAAWARHRRLNTFPFGLPRPSQQSRAKVATMPDLPELTRVRDYWDRLDALGDRPHPGGGVAAAEAAWRAGTPADGLVAGLIAAIEQSGYPDDGIPAIVLLGQMRATSALPRLQALAGSDSRLRGDIVADERLVHRLRATVDALSRRP
ncbi:HEAT repeat domain-containing protein [Dactylosporangium cerinum]|uniref:HEAT repeat domain-containing protein n=1 Tax=Dactylosporangium cerinum TaxID=1434730 RepID=A0ABV9VZP4_9ACTN